MLVSCGPLRVGEHCWSWVVGEGKVGEVAKKGRTNTGVGLALRTGRNTSAQDEEASQAVEVASLEVVKQVMCEASYLLYV